MKLLKAHVFTKDDLEFLDKRGYNNISEIDINIFDFNWDYAQTALVDVEKSEIIMWNDNIHTHIEKDIENFINGLKYMGVDVKVDECVIMNYDLEKNYSGARY